MDEETTHLHVDRSHRLGNRKLGKRKPQPIIFKFLDIMLEQTFLKTKKS